jgi:hypothetical protein
MTSTLFTMRDQEADAFVRAVRSERDPARAAKLAQCLLSDPAIPRPQRETLTALWKQASLRTLSAAGHLTAM